jgi:hypothetical protein
MKPVKIAPGRVGRRDEGERWGWRLVSLRCIVSTYVNVTVYSLVLIKK